MAELFDDDHPSYVSDIVQRCVNHPKATHQLVCTACLGQEEVAGSAVDNARLDAQVARLYAVRLLIENGDLPDALREIQQAIDVFEETAPPEGRQPDGFPVLTAQEIADWRECHDAIERRAEGRQEPEDKPRYPGDLGADDDRDGSVFHHLVLVEGCAPTETPQEAQQLDESFAALMASQPEQEDDLAAPTEPPKARDTQQIDIGAVIAQLVAEHDALKNQG